MNVPYASGPLDGLSRNIYSLFWYARRMPKISDEQWQQRRAQILEAAWRCFHRKVVQSTTMEEIIAESRMAASAMYRYFGGKDDIILSAISASLGGLAMRLAPLLQGEVAATPAELVAKLLVTVEQFSARDGYNLLPIAIHGWSEAQRDERVRELLRGFYLQFRSHLAARVAEWQRLGIVGGQASPLEVAQALQSMILGFIVQATIMRDVAVAGQARGLGAMMGAAFDGSRIAGLAPPVAAEAAGPAGPKRSRTKRARRGG